MLINYYKGEPNSYVLSHRNGKPTEGSIGDIDRDLLDLRQVLAAPGTIRPASRFRAKT